MSESLREQPVREPRVAWEQWAVQVRPERPPGATALEAALAVVAEARDDPSQRFCPLVEVRTAGVVLEAGQRSSHSRLQLAPEQYVPDHPPLAGQRVQREEADAGQLGSRTVTVEPPEQLVPAADRQEGGTCLHSSLDALALGGEVRCDQRLLPVLPAADVEQIVSTGAHLVSRPDLRDFELDPAPGGTPLEDGDVAPVGVDVQVVRIEVPDDHLHAARSQ
jgi:hypothetical protein